ncbi:MAG: hypothetical protein A3G81_15755 [Betaproteobacteria bacterium RIFCSPLOWO2_12_FULL_65_14]|nr:MAG: hypothetical protein A3G81_15755 [Betaproteobacteria bacterium RIFCSPLOWO2_12_FULL_65_14]
MVEPANLADFFTIFVASAMVIMLGALYALLFAFSRLKRMPRLMPAAYIAYGALSICVLLLARATHLFNSPVWAGIVVLMLAGYLLARHAIWRLCTATHPAGTECDDAGTRVHNR